MISGRSLMMLALALGACSDPAPPMPTVAENVAQHSGNSGFHCPKPGTIIKFSDGSATTFQSGHGLTCVYATRTGAPPIPATIFGPYSNDGERELNKLWPLSVGNQVKITSGSFVRTREETFAVLRQEPVTVPAGTFDAFVIEWQGKEIGADHAEPENIVYWFAPEVGYFVKTHSLSSKVSGIIDREALQIVQ